MTKPIKCWPAQLNPPDTLYISVLNRLKSNNRTKTNGLVLQGDNLGKRHKHFNLQVNDAIRNNISFEVIKAEYGTTDIDNLFKIEIASKCRNVEYILEVFKSEDLLYVSRAIKKSTWLITNDQYAHIVNPQYLNAELFPYMTSKAICKLLLHIRLNLKDEARVEEFFKYYEHINISVALKWLPNCSVRLIEKTISKHSNKLTVRLFKRLCERSFTIFENFSKESSLRKPYLKSVVHFLNTDNCVEKYLIKAEPLYDPIKYSKKQSAAILKNCPERVIDRFEKYANCIDLEALGSYLGKDNIEGFIIKQAQTNNLQEWFTTKNIKCLTKLVPKDVTFALIKNLFTNMAYEQNGDKITVYWNSSKPPYRHNYQCYYHASFEVAFQDLTELIKSKPSSIDIVEILKILLETADDNSNHIHTLLQYILSNYVNEPFKNKIKFVNALLTKTDTHKFDSISWTLLNELFTTMEVYIDSNNNVDKCIESIIVYQTLHQIPIPEKVMDKFKFNTLKHIKPRLNENEREIIFKFLYKLLEAEIEKETTTGQHSILKRIQNLENMLELLNDWDKELVNYPSVHKKIKTIAELNSENKYQLNLKTFYNKNKYWRKHLFEESLMLSPSEETYMNVLKHDWTLLQRYSEDNINRSFNGLLLLAFFSKLRIYWHEISTDNWLAYYNNTDQKEQVLTKNLCALLPQNVLLRQFDKNTSEEPTAINIIDSYEIRRNLTSLLHRMRPQPDPSVILNYARSDLHCALPSLLASFHNLPSNKSKKYIPQLLSCSLSLQKHGIRFAFSKLALDELHDITFNIWNTTKDLKIRVLIFHEALNSLSIEKHSLIVKKKWELLEKLMENVSDRENDKIYKLLGEVDKIPRDVRGKFLMKSYVILKNLSYKANKITELAKKVRSHTACLMDSIDPQFVEDILLEYIDKWFVKKNIFSQFSDRNNNLTDMLVAYVLCCTDENVQKLRYEKVLKPILDHCFAMWRVVYENREIVKEYFEGIYWQLVILTRDHCIKNNYIVPSEIFKKIANEVETRVSLVNNYEIVITCKLALSFVHSYDVIKSELTILENLDSDEPYVKDKKIQEKYRKMWTKLIPFFSQRCMELLKEDTDKYFPSISILFNKTLHTFSTIMTAMMREEDIELPKALIADRNNIAAYLTAIELMPLCYYDEVKMKQLNELRKCIKSHPSDEVKMHYCQKFHESSVL